MPNGITSTIQSTARPRSSNSSPVRARALAWRAPANGVGAAGNGADEPRLCDRLVSGRRRSRQEAAGDAAVRGGFALIIADLILANASSIGGVLAGTAVWGVHTGPGRARGAGRADGAGRPSRH